MNIFAYCASRRESLHALLLTVFRLVLLCAIAANLGCVTLSADVAVVVTAEALLHSAGAVVKLALMYLAIPNQSGVNSGVGHFRLCKFNNDR